MAFLKKIGDDIVRYLSIKKIHIEISWRYRRNFRNLRMVEKMTEKVMRHESVVWQQEDDFSKSVILFTAKTIQRLQAIELLCRKGFGKDAMLLLRAVFEDLVTLKYMQADKNRIKDFVDFDRWERFRLGQILLSSDVTIDRLRVEERQKQLQKEWDEVKARFTKNGRVFTRWSGKSLEEMCEDPDLKGQYDFSYGYFSKYIHPSLLTADEYILGKDGDNMVVQVGPNGSFVKEVLQTTCSFIMQLLGAVNAEYKMGFDDSLQRTSDAIMKK